MIEGENVLILNFISMLIMLILLFIAAYEDYRTGIVNDMYKLSIGLVISGICFAISSKSPIINVKINIIITLIVFIFNYTVYFISSVTNRNGWGGADVMILSTLSCGMGIYVLFTILFSTVIAIIYTMFKAAYHKTALLKTETRFLPFVFISNIIVIFFIK